MATILIYDNLTGRMERYQRSLSEAMPYNTGHTLTVREFRGKSNSSIMWTDRRTMNAIVAPNTL